MSADEQGNLRDELLAVLLRYFEPDRVTPIEAAVACIGACAVALAIIPDDEGRSEAARLVTEASPRHAKKRRQEILSGQFDRNSRH